MRTIVRLLLYQSQVTFVASTMKKSANVSLVLVFKAFNIIELAPTWRSPHSIESLRPFGSPENLNVLLLPISCLWTLRRAITSLRSTAPGSSLLPSSCPMVRATVPTLLNSSKSRLAVGRGNSVAGARRNASLQVRLPSSLSHPRPLIPCH